MKEYRQLEYNNERFNSSQRHNQRHGAFYSSYDVNHENKDHRSSHAMKVPSAAAHNL